MAACVKCGNTSFSYEEHKPQGAEFKQGFVVCSQCKTVAGLASTNNFPVVMNNLGAAIGAMASQVDRIERILLDLHKGRR